MRVKQNRARISPERNEDSSSIVYSIGEWESAAASQPASPSHLTPHNKIFDFVVVRYFNEADIPCRAPKRTKRARCGQKPRRRRRLATETPPPPPTTILLFWPHIRDVKDERASPHPKSFSHCLCRCAQRNATLIPFVCQLKGTHTHNDF